MLFCSSFTQSERFLQTDQLNIRLQVVVVTNFIRMLMRKRVRERVQARCSDFGGQRSSALRPLSVSPTPPSSTYFVFSRASALEAHPLQAEPARQNHESSCFTSTSWVMGAAKPGEKFLQQFQIHRRFRSGCSPMHTLLPAVQAVQCEAGVQGMNWGPASKQSNARPKKLTARPESSYPHNREVSVEKRSDPACCAEGPHVLEVTCSGSTAKKKNITSTSNTTVTHVWGILGSGERVKELNKSKKSYQHPVADPRTIPKPKRTS